MTTAPAARSRVLVTGGAGFIGSHLVERLVADGSTVTVVDNFVTGDAANLAAVAAEVEILEMDLRTADLRALLAERRFATIFHLAANAYVPPSVEDPRGDLEINLMATFELLEAMRHDAREVALVNVSSGLVHGGHARHPLGESDATVPDSPYAVSKLAAERYVAVYAPLYGLRAVSARLFPVYGPRLRKQVVYDLIAKLHTSGDRLNLHGDGSQVRDFNYVANVVDALILLAERAEGVGEVYNVGGDQPTSIAELARLICDQMGVTPELVYSGDVRPGDSQRLCADISRLRSLGYEPRRRLAEGLEETIAWYREHPETLSS